MLPELCPRYVVPSSDVSDLSATWEQRFSWWLWARNSSENLSGSVPASRHLQVGFERTGRLPSRVSAGPFFPAPNEFHSPYCSRSFCQRSLRNTFLDFLSFELKRLFRNRRFPKDRRLVDWAPRFPASIVEISGTVGREVFRPENSLRRWSEWWSWTFWSVWSTDRGCWTTTGRRTRARCPNNIFRKSVSESDPPLQSDSCR